MALGQRSFRCISMLRSAHKLLLKSTSLMLWASFNLKWKTRSLFLLKEVVVDSGISMLPIECSRGANTSIARSFPRRDLSWFAIASKINRKWLWTRSKIILYTGWPTNMKVWTAARWTPSNVCHSDYPSNTATQSLKTFLSSRNNMRQRTYSDRKSKWCEIHGSVCLWRRCAIC